MRKKLEDMKGWDDFETTEEIEVPDRLIDQIIGQDRAVEVVKKAAKQRRNILLVGEPGTGKSMLAMAMSELLPNEELVDILVYPNPIDENNPKIRVVKAGEGWKLVEKEGRKEAEARGRITPLFSLAILLLILPLVCYTALLLTGVKEVNAWVFLMPAMIGVMLLFFAALGAARPFVGLERMMVPKLLVDNSKKEQAPFYDGTSAHAGALLGDVKHDPFQSGGLGTPPHLRVVPGLIHKAHKGVLFIDEISTLGKSQQDLLTAMQEKKLAITGRSEHSSGAMVMTEPVPCDFVLVAAGNMEDIKRMHPALRSRIRGYGYEVYMNDVMPDTDENRKKLVQFVAQEVRREKGKIPHFTRDAVREIVREAQRRAGVKGKLTLKLRDLGGLVRAAGDVARTKERKYVTAEDVLAAKQLAKTLEQQISDKYLELRREYEVLITEGGRVGRVNGLAVLGDSGIVLPIEAEVTPGGKKSEIIATGRLGEIAKEAIHNVSAVIMKVYGEDIKEKYDIFVQFVQSYEGVEGDSASISVAVAVISALKGVKVDQSVGMTGSLTIRGEVLPVGGLTQKVEAAIDAGLKKVIIPKANEKDVLLDEKRKDEIEVVTAQNLIEVLKHSLLGGEKVIEEMSKCFEEL